VSHFPEQAQHNVSGDEGPEPKRFPRTGHPAYMQRCAKEWIHRNPLIPTKHAFALLEDPIISHLLFANPFFAVLHFVIFPFPPLRGFSQFGCELKTQNSKNTEPGQSGHSAKW